MKSKYLILSSLSFAIPVVGAPRDSADYSINAEAVDGGGHRSSSTNYTSDGSAGLIAGYSTASSPAGTVKTGYIGQLYEVIGIALNGSSPNVNELETLQLDAWQLLDDISLLDTDANSFIWSVISGPVSEISASGLATTGPVYQNTQATIQGSYAGFVGWFNFTVLDLLTDNFGSYAGDGIDDSWQNQFFGMGNPKAGPSRDPDADGQDNLFEFTAGIVPTDPNSRFYLRVEPVAGEPDQKRLVFSPRWSDRTYNIIASHSLMPDSWFSLTGGIISDNGNERAVTDPDAGAPSKFYRVEVSKP